MISHRLKIMLVLVMFAFTNILNAEQWIGNDNTNDGIKRTGGIAIGEGMYAPTGWAIRAKGEIEFASPYSGVLGTYLYYGGIGSTSKHYMSIGSDGKFIIRAGLNAERNWNMVVQGNGNVGIGVDNPNEKLSVNGTIKAKEIIVTNTGWADYVFEDNYDLKPLNEVAKYIEENKHLPGIPTTKEVEENGVSVGEMQAKLLEKVEELTLYMIDLKKENQELKTQLNSISLNK